MGTTERRERERERRTNDIINAAEKVFFKDGMEHARMDDVAEEAELSKGTLYLYFKSKEELYLAINLRGFELMKSMLAEYAAKSEKGIDQVRAIGEAYFEFNRQHPNYVKAMMYYDQLEVDFKNISDTEMKCLNAGTEAISVLVGALQTGIADGSIKPETNPLNMAMLLWSSSLGLIHVVNLKGDILENHLMVNINELVNYYFDFVESALSTKI